MACKGLMPAENPCQSAQAFGTCSPDVRDKPGAFAHARTLEILVCQKPKHIEDEREHSGAPMHDVRMAKFDRCKPVAKSRSFFFSLLRLHLQGPSQTSQAPVHPSVGRRCLARFTLRHVYRLPAGASAESNGCYYGMERLLKRGRGSWSMLDSAGEEVTRKLRRCGIQSVIFWFGSSFFACQDGAAHGPKTRFDGQAE